MTAVALEPGVALEQGVAQEPGVALGEEVALDPRQISVTRSSKRACMDKSRRFLVR